MGPLMMVHRSRITALLTCAAAIASFVSLRFARSVFQGLLGRSGTADLPRPTVFVLGITHPAFLLFFLLICLAVVVAAEAAVKSEATRLLVQVAVLLLLVSLLAVVALPGFLIPFYIPDVRIP